MFGLTLTLAALVAAATATGYIDGREYVYEYKGQVYSGFPRIKPQYSGYAFHSNVIIQPHGDYAIMKVDNAQKSQFNGEFENVAEHPHSYEALPAHAEFLTKPFKVYRKNGIVSHFEVSKGEPSFSVNLKRGLIALFNLNFNEAEVASSGEEDIQKPDHVRHYYKVHERGVLGDCETAYVIEHHPYHRIPQNNIVLNVTKVRNYDKCKSSPNQVYGVFHGHDCGEAEHEKSHTLHQNAEFHYGIRGHRHHYVIEKIETVGEVANTPFPLEGQTVSTNIHRHLELVHERPVTSPLEVGEETDRYSSLEFEFDFHKNFKDPVDLKKPHYLFHLTGRKVPLDVIKGQVEELVQVYKDDTYQEKIREKHFPEKFVELLRSLGSVGYEELEDLYKQYAEIPATGATEEQKRYRSLFYDSLVNMGTNPALLFGKYLIVNQKLNAGQTAYFLSKLPYHVKEVSETLLDELQELCEHESVKKHEDAHVACVFSLSNVVHDHCVARYHPETPASGEKHSCQPEDAIKYFEYIAKKFDETNDEKLKTAYLKAAGNVGLKEILPHVEPYIVGAAQSNRYLRSNAIWSLINVGFRYPEKVRDLLVPILFNQSENYEYRVTAYDLLSIYRPQLYEIEAVARSLKHDIDTQFRSHVYSHFKSLVNSTHPCDRKIAKDVHYALRILEEDREEYELYDYTFSKDYYVSGYNHDYDYGGSTRFSFLASDTGYIPRSIYMGVEDYIGGKSFQTLGFGFQQYGLEKFFDKLFGPEGSIGKKSIFDLFKKREKRDAADYENEVKDLMKEIVNLPKIQYEPIHGELFLEYMGNHISFFHFDDSTFEDFFKNGGRFSIPNLPAFFQRIPEFTYQRFMLSVDKMYVFPSESGIPIIFDYKYPSYYYHRNKESSFKVETGFFSEERGGKWPDHVKAETDGHIAYENNVLASIGVIIPFDQVIFGAGIKRGCAVSLPLKLKLDLDVAEKKLNSKWTPVAPHEIYHTYYEPHTFVDSYVNDIPTTQEHLYLPVQRLNRKEMKESFLHDFLGVGFDVDAKYETEFNDKASWLQFLFEKDYREKFYYLYTNPHFEPFDVSVKFSHAAEGATKQVKGSIKYKFEASEYTEAEFPNEGFEDYKISEMPSDAVHPFYANILEGELIGAGDKDRKARASLSFSTSLKGNPYKINFYYNRSPFRKSESENLKICGSSYLKFPTQNSTFILYKLNTTEVDYTTESKLKVHFGKDCSSDQKIEVDARFRSTDEQRDMDARREEPVTAERYNPYAYYYQACMKDKQRGVIYGDNCIKYVEDLVKRTYGYRIHTKFENLSPEFLNCTSKLGDWFKHKFFYNGDHNTIDVHNSPDEMTIDVDYSMRLPIADIRVTKPNSISHYNHVYLPEFHGLRAGFPYELFKITYSTIEVFCQLEGKSVYTFDRFEYDVPHFDCYTVIARDCSPDSYFTVLGADIEHPKYKRIFKMYLANHKIEGFPTNGNADSGLTFLVDGKEVDTTKTFYYYEHEGDLEPLFHITFNSVLNALHSKKYDLIAEYDGTGILMMISPYYRNKVCGLCGNFNGQKYDSVPTPSGCEYVEAKDYVRAFAIPSETCSPAGATQMCPREGGFGCAKLRTKIYENIAEKTTCFSTEPVTECESHCKASSTASQKISFHCLPSKDDSTKALVRQQAHRVIHEVRRKSKDHEAEVEVPDMCLQI